MRLDLRPGALFRGNTASELFGGAVCVAANAPQAATVRGATFAGCAAGAGGGALAALCATITVENSTFDGNAAGDGGAVFSAGSWVNVSASLLTRNAAVGGGSGAQRAASPPPLPPFSASAANGDDAAAPAGAAATTGGGGRGGAAFLTTVASYFGADGAPASLSAVPISDVAASPRASLSDCRLRTNTGAALGGAVAAQGGVSLSLSSSFLYGNYAGASYAQFEAAAASLAMPVSAAGSNSASASSPVPTPPPPTLSALSSWSADNAGYAAGSGGALWVGPGAAVAVSRSQLVFNSAARDGGAACVAGAGASLSADSCLFSANAAATGAGGAFLLSGGAALAVSASDVRGHSAALGGLAAFAALPSLFGTVGGGAGAAAATAPHIFGSGSNGSIVAASWNVTLRQLSVTGSTAVAGGLYAAVDSSPVRLALTLALVACRIGIVAVLPVCRAAAADSARVLPLPSGGRRGAPELRPVHPHGQPRRGVRRRRRHAAVAREGDGAGTRQARGRRPRGSRCVLHRGEKKPHRFVSLAPPAFRASKYAHLIFILRLITANPQPSSTRRARRSRTSPEASSSASTAPRTTEPAPPPSPACPPPRRRSTPPCSRAPPTPPRRPRAARCSANAAPSTAPASPFSARSSSGSPRRRSR